MIDLQRDAAIDRERAAILGKFLGRIFAPNPPLTGLSAGAQAFLADDDTAAARELTVERDAIEAERFAREIERDARLPDEDQ